MNPSILSILSVSLLSLPLAAQDAQKLGTKLGAKKGDAAAFVVRGKQKQEIDMGGQTMEAGNQLTHDIAIKVADVDDQGNLTVEVHMKRIRGSIEMPMMGSIEFDTAKKSDDEGGDEGGFGMPTGATMASAMRPLTEKALIAKVSPRGKVESIQGLEEALEKARSSAGPMGGGMLAGVISEGPVRAIVSGLFGLMPEEPVAVGGTWQRVETDGGRMPMKQSATVTLKSLSADSYEIALSGTIQPPTKEDIEKMLEGEGDGENAEMARAMLETMKIKNGKLDGQSTVDRSTGFVKTGKNTVKMDMTMESPMGGDMTIAVTNTVDVSRQGAETPAGDKGEKSDAGKGDGKR